MCFEGVNRGWIEGCRRVTGIDGCFLKGICCGELLCVMGRHAYNHIYPIAWVVIVSTKRKTRNGFLNY